MNYRSTGVGAANHLVAELFNGKAGLKMTHVPYRGTALAVGDLLGGPAHDGVRRSDQRAGAHQVRQAARACRHQPGAFAVAPRGTRQSPRGGYPGFEALALARHPGAGQDAAGIVKKLNEEVTKALGDPETRALLVNQAMQTVGSTPEEFAAFIHKDIAIWKAGRGGGERDGGVALGRAIPVARL